MLKQLEWFDELTTSDSLVAAFSARPELVEGCEQNKKESKKLPKKSRKKRILKAVKFKTKGIKFTRDEANAR